MEIKKLDDNRIEIIQRREVSKEELLGLKEELGARLVEKLKDVNEQLALLDKTTEPKDI